LLSKYENFTLEWRGNMGEHRPKSKREFEESVSFGKARGEGEHRGFLGLCQVAWLCINAQL
jgi:hypothetical protein